MAGRTQPRRGIPVVLKLLRAGAESLRRRCAEPDRPAAARELGLGRGLARLQLESSRALLSTVVMTAADTIAAAAADKEG